LPNSNAPDLKFSDTHLPNLIPSDLRDFSSDPCHYKVLSRITGKPSRCKIHDSTAPHCQSIP
jgi:hypothetical protein